MLLLFTPFKHINSFNSLYWDFCSVSTLWKQARSFSEATFNSLYWDFCSVSKAQFALKEGLINIFQFPLLGFLFCIPQGKGCGFSSLPTFQFPLLGFLFCIFKHNKLVWIGGGDYFQFPLLGFLFCIKKCLRRRFGFFVITFNSLYWDFCSVSVTHLQSSRESKDWQLSIPFIGIFVLYQAKEKQALWDSTVNFQFPLLGFLFCIGLHGPPQGLPRKILSIPFIGIFVLYLQHCKVRRASAPLSFNSLYWDFCSVSWGQR